MSFLYFIYLIIESIRIFIIYIYSFITYLKYNILQHKVIPIYKFNNKDCYLYKIYNNSKPYYIISQQNTLNNTQIHYYFSQIHNSLNFSELFIYCGLINCNQSPIDLTQLFRDFLYHYTDTNPKTNRFFYIIHIIHKTYNISYIDLYNAQLNIYMNDDALTEKVIDIRNIINSSLKDVLFS